MEQTSMHPVIRDLLERAIEQVENTAIECSEIAEQLENGELLAALGALAGCETTIRTNLVIVRAAHDWQEKFNQHANTLHTDA